MNGYHQRGLAGNRALHKKIQIPMWWHRPYNQPYSAGNPRRSVYARSAHKADAMPAPPRLLFASLAQGCPDGQDDNRHAKACG